MVLIFLKSLLNPQQSPDPPFLVVVHIAKIMLYIIFLQNNFKRFLYPLSSEFHFRLFWLFLLSLLFVCLFAFFQFRVFHMDEYQMEVINFIFVQPFRPFISSTVLALATVIYNFILRRSNTSTWGHFWHFFHIHCAIFSVIPLWLFPCGQAQCLMILIPPFPFIFLLPNIYLSI